MVLSSKQKKIIWMSKFNPKFVVGIVMKYTNAIKTVVSEYTLNEKHTDLC